MQMLASNSGFPVYMTTKPQDEKRPLHFQQRFELENQGSLQLAAPRGLVGLLFAATD